MCAAEPHAAAEAAVRTRRGEDADARGRCLWCAPWRLVRGRRFQWRADPAGWVGSAAGNPAAAERWVTDVG